MLLTGKCFIKKCVSKTKEATKEGQQDFDYCLIDVVGMGFSETIFSLDPIEETDKEVEMKVELKKGKLSYVSHRILSVEVSKK